MRSAGNGLIYSTYLGGDGIEAGRGIAVDPLGNAYVTGYTGPSTSAAFPVTAGAYDVTHNGSSDAFVAKIGPTGSTIVYSTLLGGSNLDEANDIKIDASGNAYIVGTTHDGSPDYPTTVGAFDRTQNGLYDIFVTKLAASGSSLVYSTFIGGSAYDYGHSLAVDTSGSVYLTGHSQTGSSPAYPTTSGAYDTTANGSYDAVVTKLNSTGTGLVYSTYIGGNADESSYGIAIDANRQAYITGRTSQTGSIGYPTTLLSFQPFSYDNGTDAFVTKFNRLGTGIIFSTYLSGMSTDEGHGIAVDSAEDVYVTGTTYDDTTDFPTTVGAFDRTHNGLFDVFVTKIRANGTGLLYSTFVGGSHWDVANSIAIDSAENAYITGYTEEGNPDYYVTLGAYDRAQNGGIDIFVTKFAY
jgi:hypothetical protein